MCELCKRHSGHSFLGWDEEFVVAIHDVEIFFKIGNPSVEISSRAPREGHSSCSIAESLYLIALLIHRLMVAVDVSASFVHMFRSLPPTTPRKRTNR